MEIYNKNKDQDKDYTLTPEKIETLKIMKSIRFKTFQEKIKIMKQLQNKYAKIVSDDSKMIITCYNKVQ